MFYYEKKLIENIFRGHFLKKKLKWWHFTTGVLKLKCVTISSDSQVLLIVVKELVVVATVVVTG